jgi:hypothetical protein
MDDSVTAAMEEARSAIEALPATFSSMDCDWDRATAAAEAAATAGRVLAAAVEKALELADEWEQEAYRLQQVARKQARAGADADRRGTTGGLAVAHIDCANALREAITREITGAQPNEDGNHG